MWRIVPPSVHGDELRCRVLEGKAFVCHFCLSACLLELCREVVGFRDELRLVKSELRETKEHNRR